MIKKITFLIIAVIVSVSALKAQVSFGIRAGVNLQNINGKDMDGDKLDNDLKLGFEGGVEVGLPLVEDFLIQPGLLYSMKGADFKEDFFEGTTSISYLELPVHFIYKPQLGSGNLILGIGPYVAYGLGGKVESEILGEDVDFDIEFKDKISDEDLLSDDVAIRRWDAGADIVAGYEFAFKLSLLFKAQLGLMNIYPDYSGVLDNETELRNTGFGLSLGYRF